MLTALSVWSSALGPFYPAPEFVNLPWQGRAAAKRRGADPINRRKPSYSQTAGGLFPFRCISGIDMLYWRWWRLKCGSPREVTLPEGLQRDTRISRATGFPAPLYQYTSFAALSQEGDASRWRGYRNVHWTYPFWAAGCLRQWKRGHCKALI